ncbi:hypothetical protein NLM24_30435 [Nocardia zapadnayensis]|nr:hypothetical protein [Nocardia zapadnayensis]MCX0274939.1 hypothetical protein [Nocardia zapadnayensis]
MNEPVAYIAHETGRGNADAPQMLDRIAQAHNSIYDHPSRAAECSGDRQCRLRRRRGGPDQRRPHRPYRRPTDAVATYTRTIAEGGDPGDYLPTRGVAPCFLIDPPAGCLRPVP